MLEGDSSVSRELDPQHVARELNWVDTWRL